MLKLLKPAMVATAVVLFSSYTPISNSVFAQTALSPAEHVDLDVVTRIRQEGLHRSQVMDTLWHLTDVIGSRLTGSPGMDEANAWTRDKLAAWGLSDARLEPFHFGKGWSFDRVSLHMESPRKEPLIAYPRAWTPGTNGIVQGEVMRITLEDDDDLETHRGKLAGKILMMEAPRVIAEGETSMVHRHDDDTLENLINFPIPSDATPPVAGARARTHHFREKLNAYLQDEGVAATLYLSSRDYGIVRLGAGAAQDADANPGVPSLQMAAEHYNMLTRLLDDERPVSVSLEVEARFHEDDLNAYNTIAEIPGRGRRADEIVLVGAHLDSWHAGTGATDNAGSVAAIMEAVRILKAIGVQPERTIRIALWSGEEQGLIGSRAYVAQHIATRPESTDPEQLSIPARVRDVTWPIQLLPGHARHVTYLNMDNGSGKIRGVYAQENSAVQPIFEAWLKPFNDLGADTVTLRNTGSTDHIPFDDVGIPGFQFVQDRLDYNTRTHHSHLDTYDYARREDLMQASVVIASFLYNAAMRAEPLPRKPLPVERVWE
ncbi:MAG: M20/M25/M40 family metallo-hydrolase [Pseudohongiella sp.]|nr:M20/M25/M40 family metallo-hydrolase [Pseudohongiella sp.]